MTTLVVNGREFYENGFKLEFLSRKENGEVKFKSFDTSKFMYENGYEKIITRKVNKNNCIKFENFYFDLTNADYQFLQMRKLTDEEVAEHEEWMRRGRLSKSEIIRELSVENTLLKGIENDEFMESGFVSINKEDYVKSIAIKTYEERGKTVYEVSYDEYKVLVDEFTQEVNEYTK